MEGMLLWNHRNVQKWFHMHGTGLELEGGVGGWRGPEHRSRSRRIVWLIRPEEHQSSPVTTCPSPPPPFKWPVSQLLVLTKLKQ